MSECNLIELTQPNTHFRILGVAFETNKNVTLSKRKSERIFVFRVMFKRVKFPYVANSLAEIIRNPDIGNAPGDLQRVLRKFHDKFGRKGLLKEGEGSSLTYRWNPILISHDELITSRNLFKTQEARDAFIKLKNNICELCEKTFERMAIDHWRAYSKYNIDNILIAVLLCETCNNIHHNHDASVCIVKKKHNLKYIKNWISIESRIRIDFPPNENDLKTQKENIQQIKKYHKDLGIEYSPDFWKDLD